MDCESNPDQNSFSLLTEISINLIPAPYILRITYSEALDILTRSSQNFVFPTEVSGSYFVFSSTYKAY